MYPSSSTQMWTCRCLNALWSVLPIFLSQATHLGVTETKHIFYLTVSSVLLTFLLILLSSSTLQPILQVCLLQPPPRCPGDLHMGVLHLLRPHLTRIRSCHVPLMLCLVTMWPLFQNTGRVWVPPGSDCHFLSPAMTPRGDFSPSQSSLEEVTWKRGLRLFGVEEFLLFYHSPGPQTHASHSVSSMDIQHAFDVPHRHFRVKPRPLTLQQSPHPIQFTHEVVHDSSSESSWLISFLITANLPQSPSSDVFFLFNPVFELRSFSR